MGTSNGLCKIETRSAAAIGHTSRDEPDIRTKVEVLFEQSIMKKLQ